MGEETTERARKRALLALAEEMGLTAETRESLALFDRRAETATAEQLRQALTDAFITRAHTRRRTTKQRRGRNSNCFSREELAEIERISAAAGIVKKKARQ